MLFTYRRRRKANQTIGRSFVLPDGAAAAQDKDELTTTDPAAVRTPDRDSKEPAGDND